MLKHPVKVTNIRNLRVILCLVLAAWGGVASLAHGDPGEIITRPAGNFLPTYGFPQVADLDAVRAEVIFTGSEFLFSGTMNAPIGTTPEAFYVWGVDRGVGATTANFAELGLPTIAFDLVVSVRPAGVSAVVDLDAGLRTPLPPDAVSIDGNTITARVPLALLPSKGLQPEDYLWNLWPRWDDGMGLHDEQISVFAPDTRMARVSLVPSRPAGNFLPTYGFPHVADLDPVGARVILSGSEFQFTGTMDAAIGTTPEAFYVWGVDRGVGATTASFAELSLPTIAFDLVVSVRPAGVSVVVDLDAGLRTPLPPDAVSIDGNTITARVPLALLPSKGLQPEDYLWNLWPRWDDGMGLHDEQISAFIPDDRMAPLSVVR
jgi:hypothetical protein